MNAMNGIEIEGRRIRVDFAPGKGSGGSRRPSRHESGSDRLGEFSSSRSFDDVRSDSFHRGSHDNSGFGAVPGVNNAEDQSWGNPIVKPESSGPSGWGEEPSSNAQSSGWGEEPSANAQSSGWGQEPAANTQSSGWGEAGDFQSETASAPSNGVGWNNDAANPGRSRSSHRADNPGRSRSSHRADNHFSSNDQEGSSTIFVGGLSYSITEESLRSHFSRYGTIQGLRLAMDRDTGKPRGYILASY
jgi:RNA recognition motif-containing protein